MEMNSKIEAIRQILSEDSTTLEKFQSVSRLAKGINPKIDEALDKALEALGKIENLSKGEIIELSADLLPGENEKQKKRKKAIVLFIKYYKELKSEVERVKAEFDGSNSQGSKSLNKQIKTATRIAAFAKGPLGIITIAAVIIVAAGGIFLSQKSHSNNSNQVLQSLSPSSSTEKVKGIIFNSQKIPLSEIKTATGQECDQEPHYHALNHISAKSIVGSSVQDPGGCGFGKVREVQIIEF